MKIHDKSNSFECDVCMKLFVTNFDRKRHYRTHTGEKPFTCEVCNRKFAFKSALVRHQVTHSEIRLYKCSVCPEGRSFKTKDGLAKHMVYHYKPKFACSKCDYVTHRSCNLKRHYKIHVKNN